MILAIFQKYRCVLNKILFRYIFNNLIQTREFNLIHLETNGGLSYAKKV